MALAALTVAARVGAQPPLEREAPTAVALVVRSDSPELTFARLEPQLALALGVPVVAEASGAVAGTLTITWRPSRAELAVTYHDPRRGTVSRVLPAPADVEAAVSSATALATNLVNDQTRDLLPPPAPVVVAVAPPPPPAPVEPVVIHALAASPPSYKLAVASAFFPLATNYDDPDVGARLSVNLLYGRVGRLEGLQLGAAANVVGDRVAGLQMAMGFNLAGGAVTGGQAALGLNYAGGPVAGFQGSLLFNRSEGGRGLQVAAVNSAGGEFGGLQAGAVNVAGDVRGLQFGVINVARNVRGVQFGLINVADDLEGVPIGLISVTRTGGIHPVVWSGTESVASVGLKFSTRYTYTLLSAAARRHSDENLFGPGLAFGLRVPFLPAFFESDVGASMLFGGELCCPGVRAGLRDDVLLLRWRGLLGFAPHPRFSPFLGAGLTGVTLFYQPLAEGMTSNSDAQVNLRLEIFGGVQL